MTNENNLQCNGSQQQPANLKNGISSDTSYPKNKSSKNILNVKFTKAQKKAVGISTNSSPVAYFKLFRFATWGEIGVTIVGIILASVASLGLPYGVILYGEFTTLLVDRTMRVGKSTDTSILSLFGGGAILVNASLEENQAAILEDAKAYGLGAFTVSAVQFLSCALSIDMINRSANRQISRIRKLFLKAVLRQDMTWYDLNSDDSFAVRITDDLDKLREGIGEKLSIFTYLAMSFVISGIISFFYGWKLTLVMLSCTPIIILSVAVVANMQSTLTEKELKAYSSAGAVAEEVLSSIRTVVAFGGERKELDRYKSRLTFAEENGRKKGLFSGIGGGIMWFIVYSCYALAFWYGISLILEDRGKDTKEYTPAVLMIVLFGVLAGAYNLGLSSPHLEAFSAAKGSAASIFSVIDRIPAIDSLGDCGLRPTTCTGNIKFTDVQFQYPSRSDVQVLQGFDLTVEAGKTVALVGPSGCGKSTCLQLIQRLYDPMDGYVTIDGVKISELNINWLRSCIGVVGQEPVLFGTSIAENIRYGNPAASQSDIEAAAKIANCHSFITKLPDGYNTVIGERGAQVSGGQKQRIAIARALVRNPKILLLDEATSALDPSSEKRVQDALEKASRGRTTLVVSHRLSTITNADKIVFIDKGVVAEQGTHEQLMAKRGLYYNLVIASGDLQQDDERNAPEEKKPNLVRLKSTCSNEDDNSDDEADVIKSAEAIKEDNESAYPVSVMRLLKLNAAEWPYILFGCVAAVVVGASCPLFAVLFGEMYGILSVADPEYVKAEGNFYSILFLVLGVTTGIGTFFQTFLFNIAGARLTTRLRQKSFKAIISQEMAWFDESNNAVGALCARLSGDCSSVQGATGTRVGSLLQSGAAICIGIGISFYYSWNLTLVSTIAILISIIAIMLESRFVEPSALKEKQRLESAIKLASEAISNIRTVASLCQEPYILERYDKEIAKVDIACKKKTRLRGTVFAIGQVMPFLCYGLSLSYGGKLVSDGDVLYKDVIKVSEALIFAAWMLSQALAYAPNVSSAMLSAGRLMKLLDRIPNIYISSSSSRPLSQNLEGNIEYSNVEFRYPTRPTAPILQGLSMQIKKGTTIALVGPSGCGKSTCIQMLLRYYDPDNGKVDVDGISTIDFQLSRIRAQLGLVSQEPVLFDRTIAENIAYGDNSRDIPMSEIINAAKMANIHEFIVNLPKGYETSLGSKGAQLSGGQKQRVAIARALIRNPRVLLLDEATSALDNQSEKIVQNALDQARQGRTCIIIAHRLTTIQNADVICVIQNGVIVESGTHEELMLLNRIYAKLYTKN
ncbi:multidrug resistance protein homolog 49-like [Wyeomyia smithii]|uniref:multidrug resistance protein homolog 49-like n=1 Tax=Wyeomyia smithii TaxID=174621 RepID=UPI002467C914|nr:multidrug resistance protein homolog 49-like [Wyeomyia smithii]XP_055537430.1 multidrug resistance protein homolog 49-like [Wyeomyia smithii]XP_055537431.1 multidrug resistance protein homolog 49-like [Wyeomyia smithii]XP_055537432.1 multidrug resistance protein homolog 49-like [Wyeomyia smithii]XP_055537433.1 multidrug resistance protein homolog 49-like [Wyeomyia smithii]XP_055537434.1 multidrug resistance protein homolog 49-like [Wyeomyia smithii]XP_055537435.1 multidrug resistance prote